MVHNKLNFPVFHYSICLKSIKEQDRNIYIVACGFSIFMRKLHMQTNLGMSI